MEKKGGGLPRKGKERLTGTAGTERSAKRNEGELGTRIEGKKNDRPSERGIKGGVKNIIGRFLTSRHAKKLGKKAPARREAGKIVAMRPV